MRRTRQAFQWAVVVVADVAVVNKPVVAKQRAAAKRRAAANRHAVVVEVDTEADTEADTEVEVEAAAAEAAEEAAEEGMAAALVDMGRSRAFDNHSSPNFLYVNGSTVQSAVS